MVLIRNLFFIFHGVLWLKTLELGINPFFELNSDSECLV